jgi:hypothetical protein
MHLLKDAMKWVYRDWLEREDLFIGRHSPGPFLISYCILCLATVNARTDLGNHQVGD